MNYPSNGEEAAAATAPLPRLGELLLKRAVITEEQLTEAASHQRSHGGQFATTLIRLGILSDDELTDCLRKEYRLPIVDPLGLEPTKEVLALVPDTLARKHELLPVSLDGSTITLAMADPSNLAALNEIKFLTGCDIRVVLAAPRAIQRAVDRLYTESARAYTDALSRLHSDEEDRIASEEAKLSVQDLERASREAPIVKLVSALMSDAIERRASDIHVEPYESHLRIRFRIDGILHDIMNVPLRFKAAIASRVKIMASLDIAERRLPQDGAIKIRPQGAKAMSFRVSSLPTLHGEKLVLRLMDKTGLQLDMTKLGLEEADLETFQSVIRQPHGMVLITGPTGSGKSTTLYALLSEINKKQHNISTAEDPVELSVSGINQVQINEDIGFTFAAALRAFLRQDPDVIMVGEIRDRETAEISVKAALTGHLVLSTLHTNDAPSTVTRLLDMGVEPFLVSSSLLLVAAQRLVRLICPSCRTAAEPPSRESLLAVGFGAEEIADLRVYRGTGCYDCADTGYRGRIALYELLPVSEKIRDLIVERASSGEIRRVATGEGIGTLRHSGLAKVRQGLTTIEEVLRVTTLERRAAKPRARRRSI